MEKQTMHPNRYFLTLALLTPLMLFASWVSASEVDAHEHEHKQEHRQHGVHKHGVGKINIAQEDKEIYIELESPAANIVGFEHAPDSEADHEALEKALTQLKNGTDLFLLPDAAGCRLVNADITTPLQDHADDSSHREDGKHAGEQHAHEDSHEHEGETHSDITATWQFSCAQPEKLDQIMVILFEVFPKTEHLQVQYITGKQQGATKLSATQPVLRF
jgi:hypothetical protein